MNLFPEIRHIDDLKPFVSHKDEIRFYTQKNGAQVACYVVSGKDTFDTPLARECRGITFDAEGKIICRPLHKFFNINEKPTTQLTSLPWGRLSRVIDKLDGSMLTPLLLNGKLLWKSKQSFESDVARLTTVYAQTKAKLLDFCLFMLNDNYTPIFEYMSPEARIVVGYPDEKLTLLHVRHMYTGEYIPLRDGNGDLTGQAQQWVDNFEIEIVESQVLKPIDEIVAELKSARNMEGYVFQFADGEMVKGKCDWYIGLHHAITFVRERDVAALVIEQRIDDMRGALVEVGASLEGIDAVEQKVLDELRTIEEEAIALARPYQGLPPKEMANALKTHPLFGLAITIHRGQTPDFLEYFRKNRLKSYSLRALPVRAVQVDISG